MFNAGIRNQILYREDELVSGDMLLVAKNNYFWSEQYEELDFIANGDVARVSRVRGTHKMYGFRYADVTLEFPDHNNIEVDAKVILDGLFSDSPALSREQSERLFTEIYAELEGDKRTRYKALKQNPYFNALQVKYAYTVTCHKAQGGQWKNVFIDMGYIPEDAFTSLDFYRWLYTAITRARSHVYLINFPLNSD
jgi:exodeoxyribonuclease-5